MTSPSVIREGTISLNNLLFRVKGEIVSTSGARFAPKLTIGEEGLEAHEDVSYLRWSDFSEGIGLRQFYATEGQAPKRCWYSTADLGQAEHSTLGSLVTATTTVEGTAFPTALAGDDLPALAIFKSEVYMMVRNTVATVDLIRIYKYSNSGNSWGSALETFPASSISFTRNCDIKVGFIGGVEYIVACAGNIYTWSTDGSTWTQGILKNAMRITFHDDALWGIDRTGQLWLAADLTVQASQSGTVSGVETDGSAAVDDTGAVFTSTIRDGAHWMRITDAGGDILTGFIGTADPDTDDTRVQIFSTTGRTAQNWVEGDATAFDMTDIPLTFDVYKEATNKAQLPVPAPAATTDIAYISDLETLPDASGEQAILAATAFGVYRYNQTGNEWIKTNFALPEARYNGRGMNIWNADLYVPHGMGLKRAIYGVETRVFDVGPDQDHGLPAINRGAITDLAPGHRMLAVGLEGDFTGFRHYNTAASTLRSTVLSYNGKGWQVLWESTTTNERIRKLIIGSAYNEYRLWFSTTTTTGSRTVYYINVESEKVEPHESQAKAYAASSILESPIVHLGQDVEGVALSILVEPHQTDTDETIKIEVRFNGASAYTTLGTIQGDADWEYLLDSATDPTGQAFRTFQWRATFARGSTNTNRPFMHSLTLKFLKAIPDRETHNLTIDFTRPYGGRSSRVQYRELRDIFRARNLLDFTFRENAAVGSEDRFFVRVNNYRLRVNTGLDYQGECDLELVEVQRTAGGGGWDIDNWDAFLWG